MKENYIDVTRHKQLAIKQNDCAELYYSSDEFWFLYKVHCCQDHKSGKKGKSKLAFNQKCIIFM